eukprot:TRINITY_DN610_c0_g1_i9.p1 TRINITY_DN610_c0_g1~~TRINITY_DN610_c0_g1_i9.p1  ORF type:complete len:300 (+),score=62.54 TRINITY_DN610_c0_g1_i9:685-1584(+)
MPVQVQQMPVQVQQMPVQVQSNISIVQSDVNVLIPSCPITYIQTNVPTANVIDIDDTTAISNQPSVQLLPQIPEPQPEPELAQEANADSSQTHPIEPNTQSTNESSKQDVQEKPSPMTDSVVSTVLLFTDGQANIGHTNTADIIAEMKPALQSIPSSCNVFTFGFGEDHYAPMLTAIAEAGRGMYYYIDNANKIPVAFADCLGGLVSVVAQNVLMTITPLPQQGKPSTIRKVWTSFQQTSGPLKHCVQIPDIYAEETRDILFEIDLPPLDEDTTEPIPVAQIDIEYKVRSTLLAHLQPK